MRKSRDPRGWPICWRYICREMNDNYFISQQASAGNKAPHIISTTIAATRLMGRCCAVPASR